MKLYARLAPAGTTTIKKGATGRQTQIESLVLTATAAGTLTLTDGTNSYVLDVVAGINQEFCFELVFLPDTDITLTAATGTISVFVNYTNK